MLETGQPTYQKKSITIDIFKRHLRDKITIILFRRGETMGPRANSILM